MKKLIIANWKMNPNNRKEALRLFNALNRGLKGSKAGVVVCPPFVYLGIKKGIGFALGAQDCFWEKKGAFTSQISPVMLKDMGVKYALCGHSERRQYGETNEMINKKVRAVLSSGIVPVLCVGENAEQNKNKETFSVVEKQVKEALKKIPRHQIKKVIIAYEPIWARSPYGPCLPDEALTVALFLRKVIGRIADKNSSKNIKVLYGGSVKVENAKDYTASDFLSGMLVGLSSLNAKEFLKIVKNSV